MAKKVHRGELLKQAIKESKIPVKAVAQMVKLSRTTVYVYMELEHISNDDMLLFGKALGVDFSKQLPELLEYVKMTQSNESLSNEDYRKKYYDLLEIYVKDAKELSIRIKAIEDKIGLNRDEPNGPVVPEVKKKKTK